MLKVNQPKLSFIAGFLLVILLALPGFARGLDEAGVKVIAHRGGKVWAPENTMAAFKKSLELGVYGIELDIHKCKSGELVVIHDETIDRTTNGKGYIKDLSYKDLSKYSSGVKFKNKFKKERVPLLKDVLSLVDGKVHLFIEVKNAPIKYEGIEKDLAKVLASYRGKDKVTVISFDHVFLKNFHKQAPDVKIAFLDLGIVSDIGKYAKSIGATAWNPGFGEIRKDAVDNAHEEGLTVNPWTVNGKMRWKQALSMGVDGIITDDPEGLMKYLGQK